MSQGVPEHAFAHLCKNPRILRSYNREQRKQFLTCTACSGSLLNLKQALLLTARYLTGEEDFDEDTPDKALWRALMERGGLEKDKLAAIVYAAAEAGRAAICRWLLTSGCPGDPGTAAFAAARGGHAELMEELLPDSVLNDPERRDKFLVEVAHGCSLATMQRVFQEADQDGDFYFPSDVKSRMLASAAAGPSGDWRSKVEWLEERGGLQEGLRNYCAVDSVAACGRPDAAERLLWLQGRGYPVEDCAWERAAGGGDPVALENFLRKKAGESPDLWMLQHTAMEHGCLNILQLLHSRGLLGENDRDDLLLDAADLGQVDMVRWLVDTFQVRRERLQELHERAAMYIGHVPLLQWLHDDMGCERGEPRSWQFLRGCSEEQVEWLVQRGYCKEVATMLYLIGSQDVVVLRCLQRLGIRPVEYTDDTLKHAAFREGYLGLLRCLRGLGWPALQRPDDTIFAAWVREKFPLRALRWLVEEAGCRVSQQTALEAAEELDGDSWRAATSRWIRNQLVPRLAG